jgi:hypothetical protein
MPTDPDAEPAPAVVLCPDGHDNPAGARFCSRCGVPLP